MSKSRTLFVASLSSVIGVLALAGTAFAAGETGTTLMVGPVPIPSAPVSVCVTQNDVPGHHIDTCVDATPPAQSVSLEVSVVAGTPIPGVKKPSLVQIACPAGTEGAAVQVTTGSVADTISGSATVVLNDGTPVTIPVHKVVAPAGQIVTVFACAGATPAPR